MGKNKIKCALCKDDSIRDQTILVPVMVKGRDGKYKKAYFCLSHLQDPEDSWH